MADKFQRSMKWPGLDDTYYFLPLVSEADNGKVMTVENGDWIVGGQQVSFDTTGSGNTIVIDDAAHRPLRGLRVFGKTTQATTTGKNLLDFDANPHFDKQADGSYKSNNVITTQDTMPLVLPAAVYCISGQIKCATGLNYRFAVWYSDDTSEYVLVNSTGNWVTSTLVTNGKPVQALGFYYSDNSNEVYVKDVQVEVGSVATAYEPYTGGIPSPNPDYPQPLNSVGDDGAVDVTMAGKNLFSSAWVQGQVNSASGNYVDVSSTICTADYIAVTPNTVYTMTRTVATDYINVRAYDLDKNYVGIGTDTLTFVRGHRGGSASNPMVGNSYWATFRVGDGVHYLKFNDRSNDLSTQFMMVLGEEVPTTYEPYKGQTLTLSTPNGLPSVGDVCDEIDLERGVYVQRVKRFSLPVADMNNSDQYPGWKSVDGLRDCVKAEVNGVIPASIRTSIGVVPFANTVNNANVLFYGQKNLGGLTQTEFKATYPDLVVEIMMSLLTPIETPLSAEEIAAFKSLKTHYQTTTIYNDEAAEMEVEYANKNNFDADAVLFRKQTLTDAQKAQILDNIGASSRLQVHDVSVTTSLWVDSTLHADYPYQALIPVNGATSEMCPDVVFNVTEALSGNYAPVADAANGGVLIYAKVVPEADIVVPTVTLWK